MFAVLITSLVASASGAPFFSADPGVSNPPPPVYSTSLVPTQKAVADTAQLFATSDISSVLFTTLQYQGFSPGDNWNLVNGGATFDEEGGILLHQYVLNVNDTGDAFGETVKFSETLDPTLNLAVPAGSTATLHWLQIVNTSSTVNGFGNALPGQNGFWQTDNGQANGTAAAGPGTGPYYDSNAAPGKFSVPPDFFDFPHYYSGVGTYLHFYAVPTWDIFTPANGNTPASEQIVPANYGVSWGFSIVAVPEPATNVLLAVGAAIVLYCARRSRGRPAAR